MRDRIRVSLGMLMWAVVLFAAYALAAHAQTAASNNHNQTAGRRVFSGAAANNNPSAVAANCTAGTSGGFKFADGNIQTQAAVHGLQAIFTDATLAGDGTNGSPLRVAAPLFLTSSTTPDATITATNNLGIAVRANGAFGGVYAKGGDKTDSVAGYGAAGQGGIGVNAPGGVGVFGGGGASANSFGGDGVIAIGGQSTTGRGGNGLVAHAGKGSIGDGYAGVFIGNVHISGNLNTSGLKNFKIDHPLDPENKYLYHAAVESSEALNVYSGNIVLDRTGEAVVTMPDWFDALNTGFRYSLTAIGASAPGLYISEKIANNRFKIAGGVAGLEVSWQVTGVRNDNYMKKHPMEVEVDKAESERGHYLQPELFDQPEEKSIEWIRRSELMLKMKEQRELPKQTAQHNNR